jgi:hypothetical protein
MPDGIGGHADLELSFGIPLKQRYFTNNFG